MAHFYLHPNPNIYFNYLGSTVTYNLSIDEEINIRIGKAATTFGKLSKRAWLNSKLTTKTKIMIYQACVLSILLYGSETWSTYSKQEKRLNSFHQRCLRRILNIKWQDKITNMEVLRKAKIPSVFSILGNKRLRWLGHVSRMPNNRIPKQILFGELANGKRQIGRPKLKYKDLCKRSLNEFMLNHKTWE